jgi:hypothetical protein
MKIGKDVIGVKQPQFRCRRRSSNFWKLLVEIKKIRTIEQLDIVKDMIREAYLNDKITYDENNELYSELNKQASKVGKRKISVKIGPLEVGGEKEGKIL